ncbi:MAG: amino acid ABC transporter permease [Lachnospiraceae bacterium]
MLPQSFGARVIFLLQQYWPSYLNGAKTTLIVALVGTLVGCLIGFLAGIIQTIPVNPNDSILKKGLLKVVNVLLSIYVEVFRGTPMMVQAMFIYYGLLFVNIHMSMWFAAFFIVSINTGAYMAETVRGGICSIDIGQTEGAKAIGMSHFQTMTSVILPQALRNIMPQIGNNLIINIKDTSVLSVISVTELFFTGKSVAGAYYTYFESFFIVSVIYLIMTVTCSRILRYTERRMDGNASYDLANTDTLAYTSGMANYIRKEGGQIDGKR